MHVGTYTKEENEELYHDSVFQAFEAATQPHYDRCEEGISQLYIISHVMKVKTYYNLEEECVDVMS